MVHSRDRRLQRVHQGKTASENKYRSDACIGRQQAIFLSIPLTPATPPTTLIERYVNSLTRHS
jgi:hypothetical protein